MTVESTDSSSSSSRWTSTERRLDIKGSTSPLLRAEMRGFTLNHACQCGLFISLVLFSFVSLTSAVSFDLTELRNKVAKIKVNPRGNLWATGHFMGKKSVMDAPFMPAAAAAADEPGADALEVSSLPGEQGALAGLLQQLLRLVLEAQVGTQESRPQSQEVDLLTKILQSYIQSRK